MTPRYYQKMLKLGFQYQLRQKKRKSLLRNVSLQPAVAPCPRYVNNNANAARSWRRTLRSVYGRFPVKV